MQTDMTGKVALVTGGAGGIGEFICERLAQASGTVLMLDVDSSKAEQTLSRLHNRLGDAAQRIQFVLGDLNDLQATDQLAQNLVKRHGAIDVLVNNAASIPWDHWMKLVLRSSSGHSESTVTPVSCWLVQLCQA